MKFFVGAAGLVLLPVVMLSSVTGAFASTTQTNSDAAVHPTSPSVADIPSEMAGYYVAAGARFNVPAAILAGIGKVECDHDRNRACDVPNAFGATGPMQFLPATFNAYGKSIGVARPNILSEHDSVFAAAAMLSANGVAKDKRGAIFSYNHSSAYVDTVLNWATKYSQLDSPIASVIAEARSYIGVPYLYGGSSRVGIDCSALIQLSYRDVGLALPRVAQDQSRKGIAVIGIHDIQAGDLLAYGSSINSVEHITMAVSADHMIEAPHAGTVVREVPVRTQNLVAIRRIVQ